MYNKITIIGHLGRDPEMRYTPNGDPVTNFSVATSRRWRDRDGQQQEETEWFRVEAWRNLGEVANQYLQKGRLVYVEGRFRSRMYQGNDGQMRVSNDIVANEIKFLGGRDQEGGGDFGGRSAGGFAPVSSGFDDGPSAEDLPF